MIHFQLCHIRFRPVSGQIFNRQFLQSDKVQSLVDFVGSKGYLPTEYKIFRGYPKTCVSFTVFTSFVFDYVVLFSIFLLMSALLRRGF